jgi:uncharacterized membrane protein YheB (UPF0754 family)
MSESDLTNAIIQALSEAPDEESRKKIITAIMQRIPHATTEAKKEVAAATVKETSDEEAQHEIATAMVNGLSNEQRKRLADQILRELISETDEPSTILRQMTRIQVYTENDAEPVSFLVQEIINDDFKGIPQWVKFKDEHGGNGLLCLNTDKVTLFAYHTHWSVNLPVLHPGKPSESPRQPG